MYRPCRFCSVMFSFKVLCGLSEFFYSKFNYCGGRNVLSYSISIHPLVIIEEVFSLVMP